jgi:hypothetical protein
MTWRALAIFAATATIAVLAFLVATHVPTGGPYG